MNLNFRIKPILFLMCAIFFFSCSNNSSTNTSGTGGIEGTGRMALKGNSVSMGVISSTGSISVNGITYDIKDANILIDGVKSKPEDLKIGMVVQVTSLLEDNQTSAIAIDILFNHLLKGMIDSIDLIGNKIVIAGQTVTIDKLTIYENIKLDDLKVGNIVSVSGFNDVSGGINATLIRFIRDQFISENEAIVLVNEIDSLNTSNKTFSSGGLIIDYSLATFNGLTELDLKNGIKVKVITDQKIINSILVANTIQYTSESLAGNEGHKIEIEGIVDTFISSHYFTLNGQPIILSDEVTFKNGTPSELVLGTKMEVSGILDKFGNVIASEIDFIKKGDIEFDVIIESIDATSIQILGIKISVETTTLFINEQDRISTFNFSNLQAGERVEIIARANDEGKLEATRIILEVVDEENDPLTQEIRATISNLSKPNFSLAGIPIAIMEGTTEFLDFSSDLTNADLFFENVQEGSNIEASGVFQNKVFQAISVKIIEP